MIQFPYKPRPLGVSIATAIAQGLLEGFEQRKLQAQADKEQHAKDLAQQIAAQINQERFAAEYGGWKPETQIPEVKTEQHAKDLAQQIAAQIDQERFAAEYGGWKPETQIPEVKTEQYKISTKPQWVPGFKEKAFIMAQERLNLAKKAQENLEKYRKTVLGGQEEQRKIQRDRITATLKSIDASIKNRIALKKGNDVLEESRKWTSASTHAKTIVGDPAMHLDNPEWTQKFVNAYYGRYATLAANKKLDNTVTATRIGLTRVNKKEMNIDELLKALNKIANTTDDEVTKEYATYMFDLIEAQYMSKPIPSWFMQTLGIGQQPVQPTVEWGEETE